MFLHRFKNGEDLSQAAAQWIYEAIRLTLKKQDRFTFVLSGGNTPKGLYELLATSPYLEKIPWEKIHFFWGDERAVPFDDSRNNAKMAYEHLLNFVPVPFSQVHVMRTDIAPEQSAQEYEIILRGYFALPGNPAIFPGFDLVLLGMGDDGHTLSLFPGTTVLGEQTAWVAAYYLEPQEMYRITLTLPIINQSSRIAFLVTGDDKARALKAVLEGAHDPQKFPSQLIKPEAGELHWFVDDAAAARLKKG
jgi:6-phosphogluconolactonase